MRLFEYLAEAGRDWSDLANELGVAVSTLTRADRGETTPSKDLIRAIHRATGGKVTANDLFGTHGAADTAPIAVPSSGKAGEVSATAVSA